MAIRRPIILSILTIGITSIVSQIVLLRELMVVFYGNEVSVGFMLAAWLILGAIGSLYLGRFADRIRNQLSSFAVYQLFLSILLPILPVLIRNIKNVFGFSPGEIIPLGILAISAPIILAPLCVTLGFLFALGCRIYPVEDGAFKIGRVYILESIGAASGGLFTSLVLIKYLGSFEILWYLAIVNLLASIMLVTIAPQTRMKKITVRLSYLWLSVMLILIVGKGVIYFDRISQEVQWRPFKVISSQNSIYGNVTVAERDSQISFFTNGLHNFSVPDELSQEEAVHFALSQHSDPKRILLVGGGAGGLLWEILKYPVERVDYVELDPLIIRLAKTALSNSSYYALDSPKVNIINADGRYYIKNSSSKYEVIIISLPDPYTAQLNRFYTTEFFKELKIVMEADGIMSFGVTSSENYISRELGNYLGSIYNTLRSVFLSVLYIPGNTAFFIASKNAGLITTDYRQIGLNLNRRDIQTSFVNEHYLFSKLSKERMGYMGRALEKNKSISANFDFRPISYYYNMALWSSYFNSWLQKTLRYLSPKTIWTAFMLVYLSIITGGLFFKRGYPGRFVSTLTAISSTGFSEIVYEIVVIISFQIIYGYLYYKLGLMLTSFMVGLFFGSIYITKRLETFKDPFRVFIIIQAAVVLYPLTLPLIFRIMAQGRGPQLLWLGSNIIFPLLPIIAGFIGGLQFPLGNKICLSYRKDAARLGGLTYGLDLIGASLGAIVVSAFIIPIIGIFQTCIAIGLLNLSVLIFLFLTK